MKKLRNNHGLTLMEVLVSILILVILVIGIGTGMDSGMKIYKEATYEAESIAFGNMLDTAMRDVLQYAEDVKPMDDGPEDVEFTFTNQEYGLWDVYFQTLPRSNAGVQPAAETGETEGDGETGEPATPENLFGDVILCSRKTGRNTPLINANAYSDLAITNLKVVYAEAGTTPLPQPDEESGGSGETPGEGGAGSTSEPTEDPAVPAKKQYCFTISYDIIRVSDQVTLQENRTLVVLHLNAQ